MSYETVVEKAWAVPKDKLAEVADFIDSVSPVTSSNMTESRCSNSTFIEFLLFVIAISTLLRRF